MAFLALLQLCILNTLFFLHVKVRNIMQRSTRSIKVAGIRNSPIVQKVSTGQTRMMSQTKVISSIRISLPPSSIMCSMLLFFIRKHNSNIRNCYYIVCFSPLFFPPCSARLYSTIFHAHTTVNKYIVEKLLNSLWNSISHDVSQIINSATVRAALLLTFKSTLSRNH